MANTNRPMSFKVLGEPAPEFVVKYNNVKSGDTFAPGDVVYRDSSGYQTSTSGTILGVAMSTVLDTEGKYAATGGSSNNYSVIVNTDPHVRMIAQISSYAITDPYTTDTSASCYDIAGTTGVQYINASSSSTDDIKVVNLANEWDNGQPSVVGAYAKVVCQFNPTRHASLKAS